MRKMVLDVGIASDIGKTRDTNQDRLLTRKSVFKGGEFGMFVVADGMGGMAKGEISSTMAVEGLGALWNKFKALLSAEGGQTDAFFEKEIIAAFFDINSEIIAYGRENNIRLGTTVSLLFIWKNRYFVCHSGDSRIYKIRGRKFEMLTKDQTWAAQQVSEGHMLPEEAIVHPNRNVLVSCIGILETPDIITCSGKLRQDDIFLICSDGFYSFILQDEITSVLQKNMPAQQAVMEMTGLILQRKATDNISAVLIKSL